MHGSTFVVAFLAVAACSGDPATKDGPAPECDPADLVHVWADDDGDGFGLRDEGTVCTVTDGLATVLGDCDDTDPLVNPTVAEVCDGVDNDCSLAVDDGLPTSTFYADGDLDGYGDVLVTALGCGPPEGYVADATDCDDENANVNPGAAEICNYGVDDDCDGSAEDPYTAAQDWYADNDGDGVGAGASVGFGCAEPVPNSAPSEAGVDCDDTDPLRYPGNIEICEDGLDQDCNGADTSCAPVGSFLVSDGPLWSTDPPVYSCLEACALLFGGTATDWHCSTSATVVDNQAYLSGWADPMFCIFPAAETFSLEPVADPGYDCGAPGCSYSAYVQDHCQTYSSTNYCWAR